MGLFLKVASIFLFCVNCVCSYSSRKFGTKSACYRFFLWFVVFVFIFLMFEFMYQPMYSFTANDPLRFKRAGGHKDLFYIDDKDVDMKDVRTL